MILLILFFLGPKSHSPIFSRRSRLLRQQLQAYRVELSVVTTRYSREERYLQGEISRLQRQQPVRQAVESRSSPLTEKSSSATRTSTTTIKTSKPTPAEMQDNGQQTSTEVVHSGQQTCTDVVHSGQQTCTDMVHTSQQTLSDVVSAGQQTSEVMRKDVGNQTWMTKAAEDVQDDWNVSVCCEIIPRYFV